MTIVEDICAKISSGMSLVKYCNTFGPTYTTVARWLQEFPEFNDRYRRAREEQAEFLANEILELCDEKPPLMVDKNGNESVDNGWVTNQKNRIETRKWVAAKLKPKVYGDKQFIEQTTTHKTEKATELTNGELLALLQRAAAAGQLPPGVFLADNGNLIEHFPSASIALTTSNQPVVIDNQPPPATDL